MSETDILRVRTQSTKSAICIFIVHDSYDFIGVVSWFLSLQPEYEVMGSSTSGDLALDQIRDLKMDLVIIGLVFARDERNGGCVVCKKTSFLTPYDYFERWEDEHVGA